MEYYAIYVPSKSNPEIIDEDLAVFTDKIEALNQLKLKKDGRLKSFKTHSEAANFAKKGMKKLPTMPELKTFTLKKLSGEKSQFVQPRSQELVQFRKEIEGGNLAQVHKMIWSNPRYLVSAGDTPAILKEGPRYNALHVAALSKNSKMVHLILQTISKKEFIQFLHSTTAEEASQEANSILLESYLNMPEKGRRETPLHLAVKIGAIEVVEALMSYQQCRMTPNSDGLYPKDIICARLATPAQDIVQSIKTLLNENYYVPLLRSEDISDQPIIGEPFLARQLSLPNNSKLSPKRLIRAYAGPMEKDQAENFRKRWKTPPRLVAAPSDGHVSFSPKVLPRHSPPLSPLHFKNKSKCNFQMTSTPKRSLKFDSCDCLEDNNGNHKLICTTRKMGTSETNENSPEKSNDINGNIWNADRKLLYNNSPFQNYRNKLEWDDTQNITNIETSKNESLSGRGFTYYCNETASTYEKDEILESPSFKERHIRITDPEKGLEIIGRNLSHKMEYGWNEYWEFLETFVDLRTPKGLQKFEKYLKNRSQQKPSQDFPPNVREDSLFGLCIALDKVDITDGNRHTIAKEEFDIINNRNKKKFMQDSSNKSIIIEELEPEPHVPNPFLCIEKSCLVYSQRYKNIFISNANVPTVICDTLNAAIDKFEQLSLSFIDDTRFTGFDFTKVHSRYARLVVLFGLGFWDETEGDYEIADKDRIMALFNVNPNSTNLMQNNSQVKQIMSATKSRKQQHKSCLWNFMSHYLNEFIITNCKVSSEIISPNQNPNRIDSEINCIKVWSEENSCQCQFESNTENKILTMRNNRNLMKRRELRRNLFIEKETTRTGKYKTEHIWASQREGNALTTFDDNEPSEDYWSCNSDYDSDDDMFWTPPQSPVHFLDADMLLQTDRELVEQYDIFIDGDEPTKTDMDVLNALEPIRSQIDVNLYPCIKKWFNCMELRKSDHFK